MMIRILLDECLPKKLKYRIEELDPYFSANTVPEAGWASISNGNLLDKAEQEFDVFVTSDRNLTRIIHESIYFRYLNNYQ